MKQKKGSMALLFVLLIQSVHAQLGLNECYDLAKKNYPLVNQQQLIAKSSDYTISNISKNAWPQVAIIGQATYQSDVTKIPISVPGVPVLSKSQYRLYGEVNQPVTDLITVRQQKEMQQANAQAQTQNIEAELYKLRERINQLYFGTLLIDEQLKQNALVQKDIQTGINKLSAAINNGTGLKSDLDKLKAEMLKARQRDTELTNARRSYLEMLGLFLNRSLPYETVLEKPVEVLTQEQINRPELAAFDLQKKALDVQEKLITTKTLPKFFVFAQGGVGRPTPVNMLSNDMKGFYLGGVRLNWSLSNYYTSGKERELVNINKTMLDVQKEVFLFNTKFALKQQNSEISKLQELIASDNEIIQLRTSVKNTAAVQLENGVITVNDYLREVNAEDLARQAAVLHRIQLLMAQYAYKTTSGN